MYNVFVIVSLDKCCDTSIDITLDPFCVGKPTSANVCATNIHLYDASSFSVLINSKTDEYFCLSMM